MSGIFDYEYEIPGDCLMLQVEWTVISPGYAAVYYPIDNAHPAEAPEIELSITLDGEQFLPPEPVYEAITERAYEEMDCQSEARDAYDEDSAYEKHRQRMIDDD